jgi:hypothetical protein
MGWLNPQNVIFLGVTISALGAVWNAKQDDKFKDKVISLQGELTAKADENARTQRELREKADIQAEAQLQLRKKSDEISALNREIAVSQTELRKKSDIVAELNRDIALSVIGGDSYCYLEIGNRDDNGAILMVIHQGKYPLYDVNIRMVDVNMSNDIFNETHQVTFGSMAKTDFNFNVGNLAPGSSVVLRPISLPSSQTIRYNIFISARNGSFVELYRIKNINGIRKSAMKIEKTIPSNANSGKPSIPLKEMIDPEYPRENGKINWN